MYLSTKLYLSLCSQTYYRCLKTQFVVCKNFYFWWEKCRVWFSIYFVKHSGSSCSKNSPTLSHFLCRSPTFWWSLSTLSTCNLIKCLFWSNFPAHVGISLQIMTFSSQLQPVSSLFSFFHPVFYPRHRTRSFLIFCHII